MATVTDELILQVLRSGWIVDRKAEQLVLDVVDHHITPKQVVWRELPTAKELSKRYVVRCLRESLDWLVDQGIIVRRRNCCRAGSTHYLRR